MQAAEARRQTSEAWRTGSLLLLLLLLLSVLSILTFLLLLLLLGRLLAPGRFTSLQQPRTGSSPAALLLPLGGLAALDRGPTALGLALCTAASREAGTGGAQREVCRKQCRACTTFGMGVCSLQPAGRSCDRLLVVCWTAGSLTRPPQTRCAARPAAYRRRSACTGRARSRAAGKKGFGRRGAHGQRACQRPGALRICQEIGPCVRGSGGMQGRACGCWPGQAILSSWYSSCVALSSSRCSSVPEMKTWEERREGRKAG